ncbi:MAG: hypothetical protein DI623_15650, partial [Sphingomonas sanxanigenens]
YDASSHSAEAIFSSGARVARWFGIEELEVSPQAVDLSRLQSGLCPLLNAHNRFDVGDVLGVVESARIEGGQLVGRIRFADTAAGREAEGMVQRGEIRGISIGYSVRTWQLVEDNAADEDVWRATSWELLEVSLAPVPADPSSTIRSEEIPVTRSTPNDQPAPQPHAGAVTAREISTAARNAGLDISAVDEMLARHEEAPFTREGMMTEVGRRYAARDTQAPTHNVVSPLPDGPNSSIRSAAEDAIFARMSGTVPTEQGRQFMGVSMAGICRALLDQQGVDTRRMSDTQVIERGMHTTSDFPILLQSAGERYLVTEFEQAASGVKRVARQRQAPDFRSIHNIKMSNIAPIPPANEAGEFRYTTIETAEESYRLGSFGQIFALSRQALINDDLGAFSDILRVMARAAAEREAVELAALLNANGGKGAKIYGEGPSTGTALYDASHANLAPTAGAIDVTTLSAGRQAMRDQKAMDGKTFINAAPRTVLVGSAGETAAEQVLATINAAQVGDVNPFGGKLGLEVDPRLTGAMWRLFADPATCPVIEYAYLNAASGPQLAQRENWSNGGWEWRVIFDFGCGLIDYRGTYQNG